MKFLVAASFLATVNAAGTGTFFSYYEEGGFGPSNWALLTLDGNQCGGTSGASGFGQSPVTIVQEVSDSCDTDMSDYEFTAGDCTWDDLEFTISNNGVTAKPKEDSACSYGQMSIPHTPNKFNALQYHIHTYSEHQIIGQGTNGYFPAELHVVHQEETEESYAVFGTMLDMGTEDHPVFEFFLQGWEAKAQSIQQACAPSTQSRFIRSMAETVDFVPAQKKVQCPAIGTIVNATVPSFPQGEAPDLYSLPDDKDFGTFTYKGGLTTPGCTEIVNWNLLDKAMTISESQMMRLEAVVMCYVAQVIDETDGSIKQCYYGTVADQAGSTSRPPQPLKGRKVTHRCRDGPAVKYVDVGELPSEEAVVATPPPQASSSFVRDSPTFNTLMCCIFASVIMVFYN